MQSSCDAPLSTRSRDFGFTWNNYTQEHIDYLSGIDCTYVVYGKEVAPTTGCPHLQGYIRFPNAVTKSSCIKRLKGAHVYIKRGTFDEIIEYSKSEGKHANKEGSLHDIYERGTRPANQETKGILGKRKAQEIITRAKAGDEDWLLENHPNEYYRHLSTFRSHRSPVTIIPDYQDCDTPHEWWVGTTGTGKSRQLWSDYPIHYQKEQNKWWDGYNGQEIVAIEEASPKTMEHLGSFMKQWADRHPFPGQIKGGRLNGIRPRKLIVLSNYTLEECFPEPQDLEPLKRRFKVVHFKQISLRPWLTSAVGGKLNVNKSDSEYALAFHPDYNII